MVSPQGPRPVVQAAGSFAKGAFHERVQCHVAHITEDVKALLLTSLFLPFVLEPRDGR